MAPTVVHLADYGGPYSGSFIPMLLAGARAVRGAGWRFKAGFTPLARGRPWLRELEAEGVEARFAPEAGRGGITRWVEEWVAELEPPLILHTHFTRFDIPAATAAHRAGAGAVWHLHSFLPTDPVHLLRTAIKLRVLSRGARFVCVSEAAAAGIRRRGAAAGRTVVIPNAIDSARFLPIEPGERERARNRFAIEGGEAALLHFAWDWEVKGGPLFAELVAELRRRGEPVVGLSVGGGEAAREAAARSGAGEGLRAIAPVEDVRSLYAAADAFVACSAAEGAPFAMLEALSCGLPVIATDIPGHRLDAAGGPAAVRLGPLDAPALAALVGELLAASPESRAAESRQASHWIAEHRDLKVWGARVLDLYREVLRSEGKAAVTSAGGSEYQ